MRDFFKLTEWTNSSSNMWKNNGLEFGKVEGKPRVFPGMKHLGIMKNLGITRHLNTARRAYKYSTRQSDRVLEATLNLLG